MAKLCPSCKKPITTTPHKIGGPDCIPCLTEEKQNPASDCKPVKYDRGDLVRQGLPYRKI